MMPKSTAPMDRRFADLPRRKSAEKAANSASGILIATIKAVLALPRKTNRIIVTKPMPISRFSVTVLVVTFVNSFLS